ncbi:MAG: FKBP-type peptidyl-prolyl cis-trans isomerase, partial [Bacteroidota bacterium]
AKFYKEEGQQFMATNKEKEGVIEHESGMQYEVLVKGDPNGESPSVSDQVTIHYEGRLLDGTIFDSSIQRGEPITFALSQLVRGWQIALPLMKPGDKWRIYLPSDLAYGDQGSPPSIPPGATLVFDIEYFGKEEG